MSLTRWEILKQGDAKTAPFVLRKVRADSAGRVLAVLKELRFENPDECQEAGAIVKAHMNRVRALLVSLAALATLLCASPALAQPVGYCGTGRPCSVSGRLTVTGSSTTCVAVDGNVLRVDCSSNFVGINMTPTRTLDITASSAGGTSVVNIANVGAGQAGLTIGTVGGTAGNQIQVTQGGLGVVFAVDVNGNMTVVKSATFNQANGSNAIALSTNGARVDLGTGASDYLSSDGTNIVTPTAVQTTLASGDGLISAAGAYPRILKTGAGAPTGTDCDNAGEVGRQYFDTTAGLLYSCNGASGWVPAGPTETLQGYTGALNTEEQAFAGKKVKITGGGYYLDFTVTTTGVAGAGNAVLEAYDATGTTQLCTATLACDSGVGGVTSAACAGTFTAGNTVVLQWDTTSGCGTLPLGNAVVTWSE